MCARVWPTHAHRWRRSSLRVPSDARDGHHVIVWGLQRSGGAAPAAAAPARNDGLQDTDDEEPYLRKVVVTLEDLEEKQTTTNAQLEKVIL